MRGSEYAAVCIIVLAMVLVSALIWHGYETKRYELCLSKAKELHECSGVKP